jgi:uncharacterized membrane protein YdjX (TVP38/TMEM64 family)
MSYEMTAGPHAGPKPRQSALKRWLPALALIGLIAIAYAAGLDRYFSLAALADHRDALQGFVHNHLFAAIAVYMAIYILAVALSLPGAAILSIAGGFLFGWAVSAPMTVIAATVGAAIIFQIVKTSLGTVVAERAGPFVKKLSGGFNRDAFNYLLFLRLVPGFPFFAVNAVAGLSRMPLKTFVLATAIGIIPGSLVFAYLGTGLDSIINAQKAVYMECMAANGADACKFSLDVSALLTRDILLAFAGLGLISLLPVFLKRRKNQATPS